MPDADRRPARGAPLFTWLLMLLVAATALLPAAPAAEPRPDDARPVAELLSGTIEVEITNAGFLPADLVVVPGSTVIWRNTTPAPSRVTSTDGVVASGSIPIGGAFAVAFHGPGRFDLSDPYGRAGSVTIGLDGLPGDPASPAEAAIPDTRFPPFRAEELSPHPESAVVVSRRRLVVGIAPGATVADVNAALTEAGTPVIGGILDHGFLLVGTPDRGDFTAIEAAATALEASPAIRYAVFDGPPEPSALPEDPLLAFDADLPSGAGGWNWESPSISPWPGSGANWWLEAVRAPSAWNLREAVEDAGVDVVAGVVDLDIGEGHPELPLLEQGEHCTLGLSIGECVTDGPGSHGTHVSGVVSGSWANPVLANGSPFPQAGFQSLDNGTRVIGLPWASSIGPLDTGAFSLLDLQSNLVARAEAGESIRVINQSAGWSLDSEAWVDGSFLNPGRATKTCGPGRSDDATGTLGCVPGNDDVRLLWTEEQAQPWLDLVQRGAARDILFVAAAGNDASEFCRTGTTLQVTPNPVPATCTIQLNDARSTSALAYLGVHWPGPGPNPILVVENLGGFFGTAGYGGVAYEAFDRAFSSQPNGTVSAPGTGIYSTCRPTDATQDRVQTSTGPFTYPNTDLFHCRKSGTSMASPLVTSLAVLLSRHSSTPSAADVRAAILDWTQPSGPATNPASPHIDAFASLLSLPGAARELVDVNDGSADGNRRILLDESGNVVRDGSGNELQDEIFDPLDAADRTNPDGVIDLRDVRRFRDAWLQLCLDGHDPACPAAALIELDGDPKAAKRDLNFDGCAEAPAASLCRTKESIHPRFDFNGDGKLTRSDPATVPLLADGTPATPSTATAMTDLEVLASQFADPDPSGWTKADLDDLLESADLTFDAAGAFAAGATSVVITADHPSDPSLRTAGLTILPDDPLQVLTVLAHQDVELTATATIASDQTVILDETLAPLAAGEDRWVPLCGTIRLDVSPAVMAPGSTGDLTATLDPCVPLTTPAPPIPITLSLAPSGAAGGPLATLDDPVPETDAFGVARTTIQAGTERQVYTLTADADLSTSGDPIPIHGETTFVVDADYEIEIVDRTQAGGATAFGSGPGINADGSVGYVAADATQVEVRADGPAGNVPLAGTQLTGDRAWFDQVSVTDDGSVWALNEHVEPGDVGTGSFQRRRELIRQSVNGDGQVRITKSHLHLLGAIDADAEYTLVGLPAPNETGGAVFPVRPFDATIPSPGPLYRLAAPGDPANLIGPQVVTVGLDASDGTHPAHADSGETAMRALLDAGDPIAAAEALVVGANVLGIDDTFDGFVLAVDPLRDGIEATDPDGNPVDPRAPGYFFTTPVFEALGRQVAISSDGRVIAFLGDRGDGIGLYLYLRPDPTGAAFIGPLLVQGANDTAPTAELGEDDAGNPIFLTDWDLDARLGLHHVPAGPDGLEGDEVVISYVARPSAAGDGFSEWIGLFTTELEIVRTPEGLFPDPDRPSAAVQLFDPASGSEVLEFGVWDPIDAGPSADPGDHRLTWWQRLANDEQQIVRATRITASGAAPAPLAAPASLAEGSSLAEAAALAAFEEPEDCPFPPCPPDPGSGPPAVRIPAFVVHDLSPTVGQGVTVTNRSRDARGVAVDATLANPSGGSPLVIGADQPRSLNTPTAGPLTLTLTTDDGTTTRSVSIELTVEPPPNRAPNAVVDGPWVVPDGGRVVLDGSGSSDPDAGDAIVAWDWDFDHDGDFDDFAGPIVDLSVAEFETLACVAGCARDIPLPITLRVTDGTGVFAFAGAALTLSSDPADFVLSIDPSSQFMNPGAVHELLVKVASKGGFADPVDLIVDPLPAGWSSSLNPTRVTPNGTSVLRVVPAAGAPEGDVELTVTGTSGAISHTTNSTAAVTFALIPVCYAQLTGRVTDTETGLPITTDRVFVSAEDDFGFWQATAALDADGRYAISNVPVSSRILIRAAAFADSGYLGSLRVARQTVCNAVIEVDLQIETRKYGAVTGRIVEGIPDPTNLAAGRKLFPTDIPVEGAQASASGGTSFITGPDGTFLIDDIPLGTLNAPRTLTVFGGGGVGSPYWGTGVSVQVRPGVVIDVGDLPVVERCTANVHVTGTVHDSNGAQVQTGVQLDTQQGRITEPDGTFEFGPVDIPLLTNNGQRTLTLRANATFFGGTGDSRMFTLSACDEVVEHHFDLVVEAEPPPPPVSNYGVVEGRVLDERTGAPVPNVQVFLFRGGGYTGEQERADATGAFRFDEVLVGTGEVVTRDDFAFSVPRSFNYWASGLTGTFSVTKDQTTTFDVDIEPIDKASATGIVVDRATGQPLEGAIAHVGGTSMSTGPDGTFLITGLVPGDGNVPIVVPGYATKQFETVGTPGRWYTEFVDAVLEPGGTTNVRFELIQVCDDVTISGLVLDAATRLPLEGAQVSAPGDFELTGPDGRFLLEKIELGTHNEPAVVEVTARKSGYVTLRKNVTVYCGAHVIVDFGAPSGGLGSIAGTVTDAATGHPIEGAFVGSAFGESDVTDAAGQYRLDSAPANADGSPRDWLVEVVGPRGATANATVTVTAGAETTQDFVLTVPVNQAPIADPQSITAFTVTPTGITLTGSDADGDPLTFQITAGPTGGTLTGAGPARVYTPAAGTTTDAITFTASDGELTSAPATISITVTDRPNQAPVVTVGDAAGDTGAAIPLTATAYDLDGDPLTLAWTVSSPDCAFSDPAVLAPTVTCSVGGDHTVTLEAFDGELTGSDSGVVSVVSTNPPPVVTVDDAAGEVNAAIPLVATATDPEGEALTLSWSVSSPDCAFSDGSVLAPTLTCSVGGTYTVTLEASDGTGTGSDTGQVTVSQPNRAPDVSVLSSTGETGQAIGMLATASDPDGDPLTLAWTVASPDCTFSDPTILLPTLTCSAAGSFTVTLEASDGDLTDTASALVFVIARNTPPIVTVEDVSGATGVPIPMVATAVDPDGDPLNLSWFVGGASCAFSDPALLLPTLTCSAAGVYEIALAALDGRDITIVEATATVSDAPTNDPPTITSDPTASVPENQTAAIDVAATDDHDAEGAGLVFEISGGADAAAFTIDAGTGVVAFLVAPDHEAPTDANTDNVYELTVRVTDSGGLSDSQAIAITVTDVPESGDDLGPLTSLVDPMPNPAPLGQDVALSAFVDDTTTGGSTIAAAEYRLDDGPWVALGPLDAAFDGIAEVVAGTIPFAALETAGIYDLCVRGVDAPGNVGPESCVLLVVYDPSGGFVTGGGWIDSPEGALVADPTATGRANFGFVAKYKKGRSVPDGQTEFMFSTGDLNFHSTSYDFLIVNKHSSQAQFKGTGTINGEGEYRFVIWATDGDLDEPEAPDRFRIRIWAEDPDGTEHVVYDNGTDQELAGGNVTIHAKP